MPIAVSDSIAFVRGDGAIHGDGAHGVAAVVGGISIARSVLPGPNSTTLSTITPMRLVVRLASARAALLGR